MRPLKGTIVDTYGGRLSVRLITRAIVHVPRQKGLKLGDPCYILYNYTTMKVRKVWTEAEYKDKGDEPQLNWDDEEEPDWVPAHELASQSEGNPVVSL